MPTIQTVVCCMLAPAATLMAQFSPIATTRYNHAISAKTDLGDVSIAVRQMLVDVSLPKWHSGKGSLSIFLDSSSGYFQWWLAPVAKTQQSARLVSGQGAHWRMYIAADRLLYFGFGHPNLIIKESREKARNLDDAEERALSDARRRGLAVLAYKSPDRVLINLWKILPHNRSENFFAPPGDPRLGPLRLVDVVHKGNTWEVILQGQWQQKIVLNDKYEVTGTARIN